MNTSIQTIPIIHLTLAFIPVLIVIIIMFRWSLRGWYAVYSVIRMLLQLILIGYVLIFIFESDHAGLVVAILTLMIIISSWIALSPLKSRQPALYINVVIALLVGSVTTLLLVIFVVLNLDPWYLPQYVIPIAGMIFANSMNTISLAAERLESEMKQGTPFIQARDQALNAAMIPLINSMLAVGLVSLPGMMTGQILSGVSPLIASRYQIMVMFMLFGASGISAACYLVLTRKNVYKE